MSDMAPDYPNEQPWPTQPHSQEPYPQQPYPQQPGAGPGPPPSNVGWAVASVLFFWPLAFSAFTHAMNVVPLWLSGNYQGAVAASERAKTLGKISLGVFVGIFALIIVFYIIIFAVIISTASNLNTTN